ncbi:MAG TPA: hypothetical protein VGR98_15665 [Streptosporangiaceae bacterium]|nr:hypothetical protein [Streptosporangiaceae bacterium]
MEPTAEQLIRDYLNRLSVAARTRLRSDDRRAFLARTREVIERRSGSPATADTGEVQEVLSSLGEPVAAVENEYARLAAARSKRAAARSGVWRPRGSPAGEPSPDADAGPDSDAAADPRPASGSRPTRSPRHLPRAAVDVSHLEGRELKGDIEKKVKVNRPLTSRFRPGQPAKLEQPSRPVRVPRPRPGGSRPRDVNGAGPSGSGPGSERADSNARGSPATVPEPAGPQAPPPETTPGGAPSAASVLPVDWLPGAGQAPAAAPETPSAGTSGPGAAPPETGTPEASAPGGSAPAPPEAGHGTAGSAARPAGGVPASASRPARVVTSPLPRLSRGRPPGVTPGRARRLVSFWGGRRLEAAAVILMALGGLVYPFPVWLLGFSLWLLGVIFAAASRQWSPNEKWAGILGQVALVIAGTSVGLALGGQRHSLAAYGHEVLADSRYMMQIAALLGAAYLAWRAYRGRRYPLPPWRRPKRT